MFLVSWGTGVVLYTWTVLSVLSVVTGRVCEGTLQETPDSLAKRESGLLFVNQKPLVPYVQRRTTQHEESVLLACCPLDARLLACSPSLRARIHRNRGGFNQLVGKHLNYSTVVEAWHFSVSRTLAASVLQKTFVCRRGISVSAFT